MQKNENVIQLLQGVKDQPSYDAAKQQAESIMPGSTKNLPPNYDPNTITQMTQKALSVKDNLQIQAMGAYRNSMIGLKAINTFGSVADAQANGYIKTPDGAAWMPAQPTGQAAPRPTQSGSQYLPPVSAAVAGVAGQPIPAAATAPIPAPAVGGAAAVPPALPAAVTTPAPTQTGAIAPIPGFKDPTQNLASLPAAQVANMPVNGASQPIAAQPTAAQVANTPATAQPNNMAQPPVKNSGETEKSFNDRQKAYTTAQGLAQRGQISQQQIAIDQQRLAETTRHDQATDGSNVQSIPAPTDANGQPLTGSALLAAPANAASNHAIAEQALADGSARMPQLRTPMAMAQWEKEVADMKRVDPTADTNRSANLLKFQTGQQGNQVRSLSVSVNHLDTLSQLTDALGNGDTNAINGLSNTLSKQFGDPSVTNFNTAKQVVADEVMKAVIGAGGGQGDRDKAQEALSSANSPEQLKGVIQTYKSLMTGQLQGLQQQYKGATGRNDFTSKISPNAQQEIGAQNGGQSVQATKVLNGVIYHNVNGQWMQ